MAKQFISSTGTIYELPEKEKKTKKRKKATKKKVRKTVKKSTKKVVRKTPKKKVVRKTKKKVVRKKVTKTKKPTIKFGKLGTDHRASVLKDGKVVGYIFKTKPGDKRIKSKYTLRTKGRNRISGHNSMALAKKAARRHFG